MKNILAILLEVVKAMCEIGLVFVFFLNFDKSLKIVLVDGQTYSNKPTKNRNNEKNVIILTQNGHFGLKLHIWKDNKPNVKENKLNAKITID